jgi:hypothetical protein
MCACYAGIRAALDPLAGARKMPVRYLQGRRMEPGATILIGIGIAVVGFLVFVLVFRWIWNAVVPDVFGLKTITFWQAVGILVLASILFGGHRVINADITGGTPKRSQAAAFTAPA